MPIYRKISQELRFWNMINAICSTRTESVRVLLFRAASAIQAAISIFHWIFAKILEKIIYKIKRGARSHRFNLVFAWQ